MLEENKMILFAVTGLLLYLGISGILAGQRAKDFGPQTIGLILVLMAIAFYFVATGVVE